MSVSPWPCPAPPDFRVAWEELDRRYPWVRALADCPQDPRHHAEGNVWIHTRMVCEALVALPAWRALPEEERAVVFAAALLHDVAKPERTRTETDGAIRAPGHSRRGSVVARQILWRLAVPFDWREQVCALVRFHQVPYFLIDEADAQHRVCEISQSARCDLLALVAEADVRGRVCADQRRLLDNVALFVEYCREQGCLRQPRSFPSDHARFVYFHRPRRHPDAPVHDDCRTAVVLLSGLPGVGKDEHVRRHFAGWPTVSLDALRGALDVDPGDAQGEVIQAARARARELLREGRPFVWNATNLSRLVRRECIRLCASYGARIRIVYLEVPPDVLLEQNRRRPAAVPQAVIEQLLDRWEVPDLTEAHEVECNIRAS
jgi:predicted kinase